MQIPDWLQHITIGVLVAAAALYLIRARIRSAKSKSGSCPNCTIEH